MMQSVALNYGFPSQPPLYARGYKQEGNGAAEAVMVELKLWVDLAPRFTLVFPDGYRMPSSAVSMGQVREHGQSIGNPRTRETSGETHLGFSSTHGAEVSFLFWGERAAIIRVCTPIGYARTNEAVLTFEHPEGESFDWPLSEGEVHRLFGKPSGVTRDFVLMQWPCNRAPDAT